MTGRRERSRRPFRLRVAGAVVNCGVDKEGPSPEAVDRAVRAVAEAIAARHDVVTALLYGSRARGDHRPDSDADLALVIRGLSGPIGALAQDFGRAVADTLVETGVVVSPMAIKLENWLAPLGFSNPYFLENVQRDGVPL